METKTFFVETEFYLAEFLYEQKVILSLKLDHFIVSLFNIVGLISIKNILTTKCVYLGILFQCN